MSEVNPNYNPFSDCKEPNEELMKAAERYKSKVSDRELGLFLNWFIRHYSTEITTDRGLLYYANAMGEEVSIADILEHYNREK
jgi:hypothetical protein